MTGGQSKRNSRALIEVYVKLEAEGQYVAFTEKELFEAMLSDPRFEIENNAVDYSIAEIRALRKS